MLRQRIHTHDVPWRFFGRLLVALLALALVWYGAMLVMLAAKVSPATVNGLSGYRTAFDFLSGLTPDDVGGSTRAIIAGAGLAALLVFGFLLRQELPRPYLTRQDLPLDETDRGWVKVEPRAIEQLAAHAAERGGAVTSASARYGTDDLTVNVTVRRPAQLAETLEGARRDVRAALERSGLPVPPLRLILTGLDTPSRELN